MGRGLAGVQVGIPEQIIALWIDDDIRILINPKITKQSEKMLLYREICMSAAPLIANVTRPAWIECEYYDENGTRHYWEIKDKKYNRVLQHEIDHLRGMINIDRVESKTLTFEVDPAFYEKKARFKETRNKS